MSLSHPTLPATALQALDRSSSQPPGPEVDMGDPIPAAPTLLFDPEHAGIVSRAGARWRDRCSFQMTASASCRLTLEWEAKECVLDWHVDGAVPCGELWLGFLDRRAGRFALWLDLGACSAQRQKTVVSSECVGFSFIDRPWTLRLEVDLRDTT